MPHPQLPASYASKIKPCIVAFMPRWAPYDPSRPPALPTIIGTGFVVHRNGLVATNRHVLDALRHVPDEARAHIAPGNSPYLAGLFVPHGDGVQLVAANVTDGATIEAPREQLSDYHPEQPDLGFARIQLHGLQPVTLSTRPIEEGAELATAGFPFGSGALIADAGHVRQLSPILQCGVVSAVLPFPCSHPHAFMLNVMIHGGASGSPAFEPATGDVVGIMHSGLESGADVVDSGGDRNDALHCKVPTTYAYGLPAHVIKSCLNAAIELGHAEPAPGSRHLSEVLALEPHDLTEAWKPWY